jgi:hypothetical protein
MSSTRPPAAEGSSSARPGDKSADKPGRRRDPDGMLPARSKRTGIESFFMRVVATVGIVAIGVALGAILVGQKVDGWIVGLVVSLVSVALAGVLWSSRRL